MTEKHFFTNLPYLIMISLATLLIWYFKIEAIGMLAFAGIVFLLLLVVKNTIYTLPFILNMLFMISQTEWDMTLIPSYLYIVPAVLILGFVLHTIIYRVKLFGGRFFLGVLLMALAAIISTLINNPLWSMSTLLIVLVAVFFLFLYSFLVHTLEGDHVLYLLKIFAILGVMISLQVALYYLDPSIDINDALEHKTLDVGWGISNFIATYLIMFIVTTTYFIKRYRLHIFWIILSLFEISMLLFTLSRAGIIAFLLTLVLLIIYMFVGYDHKWTLLLNLFIGVVLVGIAGYFLRDYFITVWDRLELFGLDDNGRIALWKEAWNTFKENRVFGAGVFARQTDTSLNDLRMFHNTFLNMLAWFGTLGGVALLIQIVSIILIFFTKLTQEKAILLIALIGANLHGMVDNIYLMPQYMVIMFIIIAIVENANKIDLLRLELSTLH